MKSALALLVSTFAVAHLAAARPSNVEYRVSAANAPAKMEAVVYTESPTYPAEAQTRHWAGNGRFALTIRPDGSVDSVKVLKSTGHSLLDEAAITALRRWRFRPGSIKLVRVPLVYWDRPIQQFNDHYTPELYGDCEQLIIRATDPPRSK
jgi:TonB family protein